jgi:PhnB protein
VQWLIYVDKEKFFSGTCRFVASSFDYEMEVWSFVKSHHALRRRMNVMTKATQPIPAGQENLIPHLVCSPCVEAIEFYKKAFGAEEIARMPAPDRKRIMHAQIRIGKSLVFLVDDFPEFCGGKSSTPISLKGTPVSIHHYVENCDAAIKRAQDAGAKVEMPPADMFWGDRYGVIVDPFGHKWSFATRLKDMTPAEMQTAMKEAFAQKS